ncbi:hypothetical protein H8356DRAFT_1310454 [Neocallimastix lanati (nom. inval.)]|jgi:membrane protease YdiL (CAAX protease family)|nr:hypothetical protein H8356DRAFT_1310454 [Neocallimastix sp. JGI-2020a]
MDQKENKKDQKEKELSKDIKKMFENEKEITTMLEDIYSDTETEIGSESEVEKMKNSSNTIINIQGEQSGEIVYRKPRKERRRINFFDEFFKKRVYITAVVSVIVLLLIDILSYLFFNIIIDTDRLTLKGDMEKTHRSTNGTVFLIFYVCIIRPILEEIVFRKLVFRIVKKLSKFLAYLLSSFLFAFAYFDCEFPTMWQEMDDFLIFFIKGITLAATYDYDGYLLASIYSNIMYNCLLVFYQFIII